MYSWLASVVHPDGEIPLFGDSALNAALKLPQLKGYIGNLCGPFIITNEILKSGALESSGYFTFEAAEQFLIIDGGELGVVYQPGHSHCDLLSYEYSYLDCRFIVDTGIGNYQVSELRQKARSIYAHNTVVVNNMDQAEIWHAFRMARRIKPEKIDYFANPEEIRFEGYYINELINKKSYMHKRIVILRNRRFFYIEDHIEAGLIKSVESLVHIHPAANIKVNDNLITISRDDRIIVLLYKSLETKIEIREWFYVPEFGRVFKSKVVAFLPKVENNPILSYIICPLSHVEQAREYYYEKTTNDEPI